jgi:hypothetical protein
MASDLEPLDLVDIAVLLLYEWTTLERRFRHTKLAEVAFPGQKVQYQPGLPFGDDTLSNRTWIILKRKEGSKNERDLSTNMVDKDIGHALSDEQLDTLFYQTRALNFCSPAVVLLQNFFDQFPPETKLRIRLGPVDNQRGVSYVTSISHRSGILTNLIHPTIQTCVGIAGTKPMSFSGVLDEMLHMVMFFRRPEDGNNEHTAALDLASMQFGRLGRGPGSKGKMPFALDSTAEFNARYARLAEDSEIQNLFQRLTLPDWSDVALMEAGYKGLSAVPESALLVDAARRVKERLENRDKERWCGYCGAPEPKSKCSGCLEVWFCGKEHQRMAWSFHKGYCHKD